MNEAGLPSPRFAMSSGVTERVRFQAGLDFLGERLFERDQIELVEGLHQAVELLLGDDIAIALEAGRLACDSEPGALDVLQGIGVDVPKERPVRRIDNRVLVPPEVGRYFRQQVRVLADLSIGLGAVTHQAWGMDQTEPHRTDNRPCTV